MLVYLFPVLACLWLLCLFIWIIFNNMIFLVILSIIVICFSLLVFIGRCLENNELKRFNNYRSKYWDPDLYENDRRND